MLHNTLEAFAGEHGKVKIEKQTWYCICMLFASLLYYHDYLIYLICIIEVFSLLVSFLQIPRKHSSQNWGYHTHGTMTRSVLSSLWYSLAFWCLLCWINWLDLSYLLLMMWLTGWRESWITVTLEEVIMPPSWGMICTLLIPRSSKESMMSKNWPSQQHEEVHQ